MANDAFPFVLAGTVVSWDPAVRVLYVGSTRLEVAPGMAVEALVPKARRRAMGGDEDRSAAARVLMSQRDPLDPGGLVEWKAPDAWVVSTRDHDHGHPWYAATDGVDDLPAPVSLSCYAAPRD